MKNLPPTVLALLGLLVASGCVHRIPEANPEDIPRLEQALARDPDNPGLLAQLGMAQFKARRFEEAEVSLLSAVAAGEATGVAHLYLGLTRESREDWGGARQAYNTYLEHGASDPMKEEIDRRLYLMVRQELRARARDALAREEELTTAAPTPGTVGVFPIQVVSEREDLLPLQAALADMMITDLALSRAVTVLERTRIQTLLDEMALTEAGYTDPASGARAGRLLRAEHIVQGAIQSFPDDNLQLATGVLNTEEGRSRGEASDRDALERLFDLEKAAVFRILDILGAELTPAEREAILENRAANLLAFLTYGQGLMALDRNDFAQAAELFRRAVELDPSYAPALDAQAEAEALQDAYAWSADDVADRAAVELSPSSFPARELGVSIAGSASTTAASLEVILNEVVPAPGATIVGLGTAPTGTAEQGQTRDPAQESTGTEGVTAPTTASIQITIRRPGGGN